MKNQIKKINLDWVGFSVSLLCAIHCAALPFILSLGILAGLQFLVHPWIELLVILISFVLASLTLVHGYRKHHHNKTPLAVVTFGFLLIGFGHLLSYQWLVISFTMVGASLIAIAHLINWKYLKKSNKTEISYSISKKVRKNA